MQNKILDILLEIKTIVKGDVSFVGFYPDDIQNIGNKYPAVLIRLGEENLCSATGRRITTTANVSLLVYTSAGKNDIRGTTELNTALLGAMLTSINLNVKCKNIEPTGIIRGEYNDIPSRYGVGFSDNLTIESINFGITVDDER